MSFYELSVNSHKKIIYLCKTFEHFCFICAKIYNTLFLASNRLKNAKIYLISRHMMSPRGNALVAGVQPEIM